jgi:hypothetical protein
VHGAVAVARAVSRRHDHEEGKRRASGKMRESEPHRGDGAAIWTNVVAVQRRRGPHGGQWQVGVVPAA